MIGITPQRMKVAAIGAGAGLGVGTAAAIAVGRFGGDGSATAAPSTGPAMPEPALPMIPRGELESRRAVEPAVPVDPDAVDPNAPVDPETGAPIVDARTAAARLRRSATRLHALEQVINGVNTVQEGHERRVWLEMLECSVGVRDGAAVLEREHPERAELALELKVLAADLWRQAYRAEQLVHYGMDHPLSDADRKYFFTTYAQTLVRANQAADVLDPPPGPSFEGDYVPWPPEMGDDVIVEPADVWLGASDAARGR